MEDTYEFCPECEIEVLLKNADLRKPIKCPNCGKFIMPCSLCEGNCITTCKWELLNKITGNFESTQK